MTLTSTPTRRPIASFSPAFRYLKQRTVGVGARTPLRPADSAGAGETYVHGGPFHFAAVGVELEGMHDSGVDVQYPWEDHPRREHAQDILVGGLVVDTHPVTNADYARYLAASGYHPRDRYIFPSVSLLRRFFTLIHDFLLEICLRHLEPASPDIPLITAACSWFVLRWHRN